MNIFYAMLSVGEQAEEAVADYMKARGHRVIDVRSARDYQKQDIDFLLINNKAQQCSLEVKHDRNMNNTGNLFFEGAKERKTGWYDGWLSKCAADYICFYCNGRGYILNFKDTKARLKELSREIEYYIDGGRAKAYLLPIDTAERAGLVSFSFDLNSESVVN